MIYLDYSATTPVDREVLNSFNRVCLDYIGNTNSLHKLGVEARKLEQASIMQINNILGVKESDVIFTSGASESNNAAIKGICLQHENKGKHIITTNLEHSSIYGPIGYLQKLGFTVDFVKTNEYGLVELDELKKLIREDTVLVTIGAVNSETGVVQKIEEIGKMLESYKCFFHVDATQAVGKIKMNYKNVDLISFTAHKFYGLKGIGCLIKKSNINIEPLIHGGKSTTIYRSGTPALPLIVSMSKALRLIDEKIDINYKHALELKKYIIENLKKYDKVLINSNEYAIPHILNISVTTIKPETLQHALEAYEIYVSTQSACSANNPVSQAVLEVTKNIEAASHSIRISLSGLTTKEEVDYFLEYFDKCYNNLNL